MDHEITEKGYRLTHDGHREYYVEGDDIPYPSCTSVAKLWPDVYGLLKWHADEFDSMEDARAFLDKAAEAGTAIHEEIAYILEGHSLTVISDAAKSALAYVRDNKLKVLGVEETCYHEEPRFAATVDLICKCPKRGIGVVDWKSGSIFATHLIQGAAEMKAAQADWAQIVALDKPTQKTYRTRNVKMPRDWRRFQVLCPVWWEKYRPES